jgi:hypothetical protein
LPLKKNPTLDKELKYKSPNKSTTAKHYQSRPHKNKYTNSFTFKYSNYVKKSKNSQKPKESNHKKKKSHFSGIALEKKDKTFIKKMKQLYIKEIESRKGNNSTSIDNHMKSPSRSQNQYSDFDDSMSKLSDFSHFSNNKLRRSKGSYSYLGSASRKQKQRNNKSQNRSNQRAKKYLNESYLSGSETDLSNNRENVYKEIEKKNDEFIEIQGIGGLTRKTRNEAKYKSQKNNSKQKQTLKKNKNNLKSNISDNSTQKMSKAITRMNTVIENNLTINKKRKAKISNRVIPTFESNREISNKKKKEDKKKKKRTIKEVLNILKRSENFGRNYKMELDCIQKKVWNNTNKLLKNDRNYVGIKTGITKNAGGCLASQKKKKNIILTCGKCLFHYFANRQVLLGTSSLEKRFKETAMIINMCSFYKDQLITLSIKNQ